MPAAMHFSLSPFIALAVTAMMGVRWFSPPRCRIFSVACRPRHPPSARVPAPRSGAEGASQSLPARARAFPS